MDTEVTKVSGSVQSVSKKIAQVDLKIDSAMSYNPSDHSGAIGR